MVIMASFFMPSVVSAVAAMWEASSPASASCSVCSRQAGRGVSEAPGQKEQQRAATPEVLDCRATSAPQYT